MNPRITKSAMATLTSQELGMFPPFVGSERRLSRSSRSSTNDSLETIDLALDDTHIGMLAEKPKNTKQYTATHPPR